MNISIEKAKKIKLFLMDVDGVLTDGKIVYTTTGEEIKEFNVKDGMGIKLLHKGGVRTGIITSRKSSVVEKRAKELGIHYLYQGAEDKLTVLNRILEKTSMRYENVLYIGDDLVDIPILKRVGFPVTVPSAPDIVKKFSVYITFKEGGNGAVREVAELLLELKGIYGEIIEEYIYDGKR